MARHGSDKYALTEHVLIFVAVAFGTVGVLIVHRLTKGKTLCMRAVVAGIEEGDHSVAQNEHTLGYLSNAVLVCPRLFSDKL